MNFISNMTKTELSLFTVLLAGIISLVTSLIISFISSSRARKTTYINTITSSRISWIQELREMISEFIQMTALNANFDLYGENDEKVRIEYFNKLRILRNKIFLHLNFNGSIDQKIIEMINRIYIVLEEVYEILIIKEIDDDSGKVGYIQLRARLKDELFFERLDIPIEEVLEAETKKTLEIFEQFVKVRNNNFLSNISSNIIEVERLHNRLMKYTQVYCKAEWDRVKLESKGKMNIDFDDRINKLLDEHEIELYNYSTQLISTYSELDDNYSA